VLTGFAMADAKETRVGAMTPMEAWRRWRDTVDHLDDRRRPWHRGGSGEPMVLIHGLSDTWRTWEPVLPQLEAHHDVLAVTLPGHLHGMPLPESDELTAASLADLVEAEMGHVGWERAHIVGNSLGGWVALELAARGRALTAVALSPAGGFEHGGLVERRVIRTFTESHRAARRVVGRANQVARLPIARTIGLRPYVSRPRRVPAAFYAHWIRGMAACEVVHIAMDQLRTTGFQETLGPISCPTRIAFGARDRIFPQKGGWELLPKAVPNAEFVVLPKVGHVPMWDDPDLVANTILEVSAQAAPAAEAAAVPARLVSA
jgi:pimeloyl-ACP methyl ester carboxylesterase